MGTATEYGLEVGKTYIDRKGVRLHDRKIIWISADGMTIRYDSFAVKLGHRYPSATADAFAKWAGIAATNNA